MTKKKFLFLSLLGCVACSQAPLGDRRLSPKEIPSFLEKYRGPEYKDVEFYEKGKKRKRYEVKYLKKDQQISLAFDREGRLLEREEDTTLNAFSPQVKAKIIKYLNENYPANKILEVEKRQEIDQEFIDVEIRHDSSPSGYWEVSFDLEGNYASREIEDYQFLETLN